MFSYVEGACHPRVSFLRIYLWNMFTRLHYILWNETGR